MSVKDSLVEVCVGGVAVRGLMMEDVVGVDARMPVTGDPGRELALGDDVCP